jgi:phosphate:Na+ symporter
MKETLIALSGIMFFLVGMIRLSSAVREIITSQIKQYIKYAVEKPIYGLFTGIISTVLFQSSSASIVLNIGLVSAGLISYYSSLAIILGADVGTTLTVQFVVWKFTDISPIFIFLGGLLWLTCRAKLRKAGEIIFYFGLIFFGLALVGETAVHLKNSPVFINLFAETKNHVLGFGLGIVFTGIVHASVIPISILVMLAQQDLVSLENALPIVIGANIGTTVTALLAGAAATVSGRRTALSHFIFKCIGAVLVLIFFPYFVALLKYLSSGIAQQIVLGHLLMNLLIVLVFIFFLQPFARLMNRIFPGADENLPLWPEFLDRKDLSSAEKALSDVQLELQREMGLVQKMYSSCIDLIACHKEGRKNDISYIEMVVNNLRMEIVKYLWKVSAKQLSAKLSKKLFAYTAITDDIESIGNHVILMTILASQKSSQKIKFSESGEKDLMEIVDLVKLNLKDAMALIKMPGDDKISNIMRREEEVDVKVKDARERHLKRFHNRLCRAEAGPVFVEMLIHLERISDHCNNIAEYVFDIKDKR